MRQEGRCCRPHCSVPAAPNSPITAAGISINRHAKNLRKWIVRSSPIPIAICPSFSIWQISLSSSHNKPQTKTSPIPTTPLHPHRLGNKQNLQPKATIFLYFLVLQSAMFLQYILY
jgi:hypothetical protein